jgi:hypothetical protein
MNDNEAANLSIIVFRSTNFEKKEKKMRIGFIKSLFLHDDYKD